LVILSLTWAGTFLHLLLCQLSWLVQGDCLSKWFWILSLLLLILLCFLQSTGWSSSLYRHSRPEFRQWSTSLCRFPVVQSSDNAVFIYFIMWIWTWSQIHAVFVRPWRPGKWSRFAFKFHYFSCLSLGNKPWMFITLVDQESI
jgi:hypothetical protein